MRAALVLNRRRSGSGERVRDTDRYDAFISYSHQGAEAVSKALQLDLERYGKPWYRQRRLRVFRDKTDLAASPHLWPTIVEALARSDWFILMASPEAHASSWMNQEVDWWVQHKPADHILIALTGGEITWSGFDFDWRQTNSLPTKLAGVFEGEPHYIDLRRVAPATEPLSDAAPVDTIRLGDVVAAFAAPIHGVPIGSMIGAHVRERRRTRRTGRSQPVEAIELVRRSVKTSAGVR